MHDGCVEIVTADRGFVTTRTMSHKLRLDGNVTAKALGLDYVDPNHLQPLNWWITLSKNQQTAAVFTTICSDVYSRLNLSLLSFSSHTTNWSSNTIACDNQDFSQTLRLTLAWAVSLKSCADNPAIELISICKWKRPWSITFAFRITLFPKVVAICRIFMILFALQKQIVVNHFESAPRNSDCADISTVESQLIDLMLVSIDSSALIEFKPTVWFRKSRKFVPQNATRWSTRLIVHMSPGSRLRVHCVMPYK